MSTEREGTEQALEKMLREWGESLGSAENTHTFLDVMGLCNNIAVGRYSKAAQHASKLPIKLVEAILRSDA